MGVEQKIMKYKDKPLTSTVLPLKWLRTGANALVFDFGNHHRKKKAKK